MSTDFRNVNMLIVEDNRKLLFEIAEFFRARMSTVYTAETLSAAKEIYSQEISLDIIILDMILPDGFGLELLKIKRNFVPPIVILSDLSDDDDIIKGFDAGAADYITKPCTMQVLQMRIAARLLPKQDAIVERNDFVVDSNLRKVYFKGQAVALTSSEFNILFFLITNAGTFFTAPEIYEQVWGAPSLMTTTVNRHLSTLRRKLKDISGGKNPIITEFGKGYCFPMTPRHNGVMYD